MTIKIESIEPKLKKDGKQISGSNARGAWKIWKVNGKYDYFSGASLEIEIGKSYEGEVKTETKDGFTNTSLLISDYTPVISYEEPEGEPKADDLATKIENIETILIGEGLNAKKRETAIGNLALAIDGLGERLDKLGKWIKDNVK